jgi:membrane associated rhomboid family serine protease
VTHFLILVLVLFGVAVYFMTTVERAYLRKVALAAARTAGQSLKDAITLNVPESDSFFGELRARTSWMLVTPALVAATAFVFILMLFSPGPIARFETLVSWGGNFGPRTIHGEWWRLLTAMFVHSRFLDLLVNLVCVFQLGIILERLVGPFAFTAVYVAAGATAGIIGVSVYPGAVGVGASGAVLGIYGLLLATSIWSMIYRSVLTIPLDVAKRLAPVAAVFVLYNVTTNGLWNVSALAALVTGLVCGIVVAKDVGVRKPRIRRVSAAMATMIAIGAVYSVAVHHPVRVVTDIGPEIERIIAVEGRTAGVYDIAVARFRKGRITAAALAGVIEGTIVPELHAATVRLNALRDVPPEHQPLVATAEKYLTLRDESWQLRAAALHRADMPGLREADKREQLSLEAFHNVKPLHHHADPTVNDAP